MAAYFRTSIAYVAGSSFGHRRLQPVDPGHASGPSATEGDLVRNLFGSYGYWLAMLVATPLLTMRLFAEERRRARWKRC
jgi:hypothetical protein